METELVTALVSLGGSLIGTLSGMRLIAWRLEMVEKKLDGLSELPSRIGALENRIVVTENRLAQMRSEP